MATGIWAGFWSETGRKVARHQKHNVQSWFARHPATFLLAWGAKGLVWNLPKVTGKGIWKGGRRLLGKTVKTKTIKATNETVTVITNAGSGAARVSYGGTVVAVIPRNAARPPSTFQKGPIMQSGKAMLKTTTLGDQFVLLGSGIDIFAPMPDWEASSIRELMSDCYQAFLRMAGGVDMFTDIVFACHMHDRVLHQLYQAVEEAETLAERMRQARNLVDNIYSERMAQEESAAGVLSASPTLRYPDGIPYETVPRATRIAACYMAFEPRSDEEATSVLEVIKVSQAGWALLGESLTRLSTRMGPWLVDRRVVTKVGAAADAAVSTAAAFGAARRALTSLYKAQMAQESTGTATILTIPLGRS